MIWDKSYITGLSSVYSAVNSTAPTTVEPVTTDGGVCYKVTFYVPATSVTVNANKTTNISWAYDDVFYKGVYSNIGSGYDANNYPKDLLNNGSIKDSAQARYIYWLQTGLQSNSQIASPIFDVTSLSAFTTRILFSF